MASVFLDSVRDGASSRALRYCVHRRRRPVGVWTWRRRLGRGIDARATPGRTGAREGVSHRVLAKGTHLEALLRRTTNYAEFRDYEWTAVEEKLDGEAIEAGGEEGWAFFELNQIDPARGGAALHEVDALRLMAVFRATFGEVTISAQGRRLLADRLVKLSPEHVRTLFVEANFPDDAEEWVTVFRQKVDEITRRTCES
jgi:hypothetical protein